MHTRVKRHVFVMALLTGLFALRVAGQAVQFWMPRSFLPAFDAFQGSNLGYSTLLLIQLLILALMLRTCLRVGTGISVPNRRFGHGLAWFGGIYMAGSLARIVIGTLVPSAAAWFSEDPIWPEDRVREAMAPFAEHANLATHYMLSPVGG